jgi:hypothetical protein
MQEKDQSNNQNMSHLYLRYIRVPTYTVRINGSSQEILQYNSSLNQSAAIIALPPSDSDVLEIDIHATPAFGERLPYRAGTGASVFCSLEPFEGDHECDRRLSNDVVCFSFHLQDPIGVDRLRIIVQEGRDIEGPMSVAEQEMLSMILKDPTQGCTFNQLSEL